MYTAGGRPAGSRRSGTIWSRGRGTPWGGAGDGENERRDWHQRRRVTQKGTRWTGSNGFWNAAGESEKEQGAKAGQTINGQWSERICRTGPGRRARSDTVKTGAALELFTCYSTTVTYSQHWANGTAVLNSPVRSIGRPRCRICRHTEKLGQIRRGAVTAFARRKLAGNTCIASTSNVFAARNMPLK